MIKIRFYKLFFIKKETMEDASFGTINDDEFTEFDHDPRENI